MSNTQRIVMPKGHVELSIAGVNYKIDETGAFEVPVEMVEELKASHGATVEPGLNQLQANVDAADAAVGHAKAVLEARLEAQGDARRALSVFAAQQKTRDDEALKAAIAKKAASDAQEKQVEEALTAATPTATKAPPLSVPKK